MQIQQTCLQKHKKHENAEDPKNILMIIEDRDHN